MLTRIELKRTLVSGTIPDSLFPPSTPLVYFSLMQLSLSGTIPSFLFSLSSLTRLDLGSTSLSGSVSSQLGRLTNLEILQIDSCRFSGAIPTTIGLLTALTQLALGGSNAWVGGIPQQILALTGLLSFDLLASPPPPGTSGGTSAAASPAGAQPSSSSWQLAAPIGGAVGGACGVILLAAAGYMLWLRRRAGVLRRKVSAASSAGVSLEGGGRRSASSASSANPGGALAKAGSDGSPSAIDPASPPWACRFHAAVGRHDVFLSYRAWSEGKRSEDWSPLANGVADQLWHALEGLPGSSISVFMDSTCAGSGEDWEAASPAGLAEATIVVPLVSRALLEGFVRHAPYRRDNVLLEWELMVDQLAEGGALILPIHVGDGISTFVEKDFPSAPHYLSGRIVRDTVVPLLRLPSLKLRAGSTEDLDRVVACIAGVVAGVGGTRIRQRAQASALRATSQLQRQWEATRRVVDTGTVIGKGATSVVYGGRADDASPYVAIKRMKVSQVDAFNTKWFQNEIAIMLQLDHPNVVPILDSYVRSNGLERYLVMPLMHGGSLKDRLYDSAVGKAAGLPSGRQRLRIAIGVTDGLRYIHGNRVLHRDLKVRCPCPFLGTFSAPLFHCILIYLQKYPSHVLS